MKTDHSNEAIIRKLRDQISKKWPGSLPGNLEDVPVVPTNITDLDSILSRGGLPTGKLVGISGSRSSGKTYFLFKLLSGLRSDNGVVIYFDLTSEVLPQVIKSNGLDLGKFVHVTPQDITSGLRTAEVLFQTEEVQRVVFDLVGINDHIPKASILRLKRATKKAKGIVFFLTDENYCGFQGNLIDLRLKVKRVPLPGVPNQEDPALPSSEKLSVTVEKNPFGKDGLSAELVFDD